MSRVTKRLSTGRICRSAILVGTERRDLNGRESLIRMPDVGMERPDGYSPSRLLGGGLRGTNRVALPKKFRNFRKATLDIAAAAAMADRDLPDHKALRFQHRNFGISLPDLGTPRQQSRGIKDEGQL
jgi:hypothetical protein